MSLEARLSALAEAIGNDMAQRPALGAVSYIASPTLANLRDAMVAAGIMAAQVVVPAPPANTVAPVVSGNAYTGQVLTCSQGTWTGASSYAYQWRANGTAISGATSATLTVSQAVGVALTCAVTATNADGSTVAVSNSLSVVAAPAGGDVMAFEAMTGSNVLLTNSAARHGRTGTGSTYAHSRLTRPVRGKRYVEMRANSAVTNTAAVSNIYGGSEAAYPNAYSLGQWWNEPGAAAGPTSIWSAILYSHYGDAYPNPIANGSAWTLEGISSHPFQVILRWAVDEATRAVWVQLNDLGWYGGGDPAAGTTPSFTMGGTSDIHIGATSNNNSNWVEVIQVPNLVYTPPAGFTAGV